MRNRPNFFVIGAQKAGTSRLHFLLGQHPEVFASTLKEPFFFAQHFDEPAKAAEYAELFADVGHARAIGESSTAYSRAQRWPGTAQRIFEFNPRARLIYMVRHPLRRIESGWAQARQKTPEMSRDLAVAARAPQHDLIDATLYWKQLSQYREFFPDEQILLLFFEEFIRDEAATLRQCFEFLAVDPKIEIDCSTEEKQNSSAQKREPTPLMDALYRWGGLHRAMRKLSPSLKLKIRATFQRPMRSKPTWDEATWKWVVEQLQADTEQFLSHAGRPADYWNWELQPQQKRGEW